MTTPRDIPEELWGPTVARVKLYNGLLMASNVAMWVATLAMLSVQWWPAWVAVRIGVPLGIAGLVAGAVSKKRGRHALDRMRLLLIEYGGVDPGQVKR